MSSGQGSDGRGRSPASRSELFSRFGANGLTTAFVRVKIRRGGGASARAPHIQGKGGQMATTLDPIAEFREDHRKVRDGILSISEALRDKDVGKAREILGVLNELTGPHFRYEEENLYPALRKYLGEYVDTLYKEHDNVIETAKVCAGLLAKDTLTDQESADATSAAMAMLIHVSNCDGLAILSERFSDREMEELASSFARSRDANVALLDWADTIRGKR